MFYEPRNGHGLPHNPFKALVSPRPIGWISTRSGAGVTNLAPYSFFNAVADAPPQVMFSSTGAKPDQDGTKDSVTNIRETGEFCVNIVSYALRDAMNASSAPLPREDTEFTRAGLTEAPCNVIACPRVAEAPASFECRLSEVIPLRGAHNFAVLGEVVGIHIADEILRDGLVDVTAYEPLARLGYMDYAKVSEVFSLQRPKA